MDGAKSFFKWKTQFEDKDSGLTYPVNAQIFTPNITMPNSPSETADFRIAIFSFLSPKSVSNVFFWDPTMGVNGQAVDPATTSSTSSTSVAGSTQVVYAFIALLLVLCVMV